MYGDGSRPFNGVFTAKIRGTFPPENLRIALAKIQDRHPILSATIKKDDCGKPWFVSREKVAEIPVSIVQRHTDADWISETKNAWNYVFDVENEPLIKVIWLKSDHISDLLLAFHHCMCDGGTIITLMREILTLLNDPGTVVKPYTAFTCFRELIPETVLNNKRVILKGKAIALATRVVLSLALLRAQKEIARGNNFIYHWKLSKALSSLIFKRCKTEGVTVNTALCLAFFNAIREVKGKGFFNKVTCPVDIRKYVPKIRQDTAFSFGLAITLSPGRAPAGNFWTKARELQEKAGKKIAGINGYEFLMTLEYLHPLAKLTERFLTFGESGKALMFSNLGRLDIPENYSSFEIETIYSPVSMGPFKNPNSILTSTFGGRMDFCLVSNDCLLEPEKARYIKEKAMAMLLN